MKIVSNDFKEQVNSFGRQLDVIITYDEITLDKDNIYSINPNFHTNIMETLMKSMIVETDTLIPIGTRINVQCGIKIADNEVLDYRDNYEYIDYGYYTVKEFEKDENKKSYIMKCYDDMMKTMVDYDLQVTYPISVKNLLTAICTHFAFTLGTNTFVNDDNMITTDVFSNIGLTYRDVLSELAIATCSTIEIEDGVMYLKYPTSTGVTIDEDILNDKNVAISEKYGPVNKLVLTRISGADTELRENTTSIEEDGLTELKISDRQIFSTEQTRDNLIDEMWDYLNGFQYYLCNLDTQGLMYLEATDRFNISIGQDTYSTIVFDDETEISDGLNEEIFNNKPIINEDEYRYTKTEDKKVKNAYIEVDKQNAVITSVAKEVTEQNSKISTITQRVDEIDSKIQEIADITVSGETSYATFTLDNVNESEPIEIRVRPIDENISYLYPNSTLYPSTNTYLKVRKIRFHNNTTNEDIDYTIPDDLLIYDSTHYDEFYLNYDSQTCQITKRCKYNADGSVSLLSSEQVVDYDYPSIILADGDYTLSLLGYQYGYLFMRLMAKNIYTSQFYTKSETDSRINQKANEIEIGVNQTLENYSTTTQMNAAINVKADQINSVVATKVGNEEVISKINQSAEQVKISAGKVNIDGVITAINDNTQTTIDGDKITTGTITANQVASDIITTTNFNAQNINANQITTGTLTGVNINLQGNNDSDKTKLNVKYTNSTEKVDVQGFVAPSDIGITNSYSPYIDGHLVPSITRTSYTHLVNIGYQVGLFNNSTADDGSQSGNCVVSVTDGSPSVGFMTWDSNDNVLCDGSWRSYDNTIEMILSNRNNTTEVNADYVRTPIVYQTSLAEKKKNIKLYKNSALDLIKNSDIYTYNLKHEEDDNRKHIGLVIGKDYKCCEEVMSNDNQSIDQYSMISVSWKAIQELLKRIETLEEKLKESDK